MHFETKTGFFFGRTPSIICSVCPKSTAVTGTVKLTNVEWKAVNNVVLAPRINL